MALYFICSKFSDAHQSGTIKTDNPISTADQYDKEIDNYKRYVVKNFNASYSAIIILSFSRLD